MSNTYILIPDYKKSTEGHTVDLVTEQWQADRRWVIGERDRTTKTTVFNNRTYQTFAEACASRDLDPKEVRQRIVGAPPAQMTKADNAAAAREGWGLFNEETYPEIQRADEAAVFPSDEEAIAFVRASQSPHCRKALAIIAAFNSTENENPVPLPEASAKAGKSAKR